MKKVAINLNQILDFVCPLTEQHTQSFLYLLLLAEYGPPVDNCIVSGSHEKPRKMTKHEIVPMLDVYKKKLQGLLNFAKYPERFRHPLRHEMQNLIITHLKKLKKSEKDYKSIDNITNDTEIIFQDFSISVEEFIESMVKEMCK